MADFIAWLRGLGWKVWALTVLTVLAILIFCGWPLAPIVLIVAGLAMAPAARIGMKAEAEKRRRAEGE